MHEQVKVWVAANITQWNEDRPSWFKIEMIPDDLLPSSIFEVEGEEERRRSSIVGIRESLREVVRGVQETRLSTTLLLGHSARRSDSVAEKMNKKMWRALAEETCACRSNNYKSNFQLLKRVFKENEVLLAPTQIICPKFKTMLSYILADRFGLRVHAVDKDLEMKDWGNDECRKVGMSLATLFRSRETGAAAVEAWTNQYDQVRGQSEATTWHKRVIRKLACELARGCSKTP